ncbi:CTB family bacteriocin [Calothrix sp. NIES-2098]|uniref:CTB family bacteriocin n=1 Tax=Calothrix sp. NIES-2098 TaxID=1954171 RepID=UPI000B5E8240|nr:hypothetical protein NIES2098_23190 [Calothrix sp. NIES-2098]BAY09166.1 hypothetical protein NIES2098_23280 [Calothrix sp. NIES-2098]
MSAEINKAIELSEDELDVVAGGNGLVIDGVNTIFQTNANSFDQDQKVLQQVSSAGPGGANSASNVATLHTSSFSFQQTFIG